MNVVPTVSNPTSPISNPNFRKANQPAFGMTSRNINIDVSEVDKFLKPILLKPLLINL